MRYRLRTTFWFLWVPIFAADLGAVIWYLMTHPTSVVQKNIFATNFLWISLFSTFFMICQYTKIFLFEKYRRRYPLLESHERETIDSCLETMSGEQLTAKSKATYSKVVIGANICAFGYKTFHIETAEKMKYSLETILQAQFTIAFTMVIQATLCISMYIDFARGEYFSVVDAPNVGVLNSRLCCAMIMHLQTEQYVRFGLDMMKYALNHPKEFTVPLLCATIGFFYSFITMSLSLACIIKMCTQSTFIDTLSSYVSYTAICFLPNFVYLALPIGAPLRPASPDLIKTNFRRNIEKRECRYYPCLFVYRVTRIIYGSIWFYFLPITALVLPFITHAFF